MTGLIIDSFAGGGGASTGMKLGSLFDGSGGFPLAGAIHGISPAWAAEIEPYPIRVTKARFPQMKHLGSVLDVNGAEVEPVDIITFGSPCQDLSVAGKQAGLHKGERSNLFFEAIRIIKEMRRSTDGRYPRIAVWENVPGAYSSNKGEDFRAVLEAFAQINDEAADVPRPASGKWNPAGAIVGNGWSIAWRTFDAQYWGVPQRRKRIYLIADFGSERAGEILFEQEGLRGDSAESGTAGQSVAGDAAGSVRRGCVAWTYRGRENGCNIEYQEEVAYALRNPLGGGSNANVCYAVRTRNTMANGWGVAENAYTLDTSEGQAVAYSVDSVCYAIDRASFNQGINAKYDICIEPELNSPLVARGPSAVCYPVENHPNDSRNYIFDPVVNRMRGFGDYEQDEKCSAVKARDYKDATDLIVEANISKRRYIIRRLTPLETCRLQGFPDWWEGGVQGSDSARYKMWGNGIALPNAAYVIGCAKKLIQGEHQGQGHDGLKERI